MILVKQTIETFKKIIIIINIIIVWLMYKTYCFLLSRTKYNNLQA